MLRQELMSLFLFLITHGLYFIPPLLILLSHSTFFLHFLTLTSLSMFSFNLLSFFITPLYSQFAHSISLPIFLLSFLSLIFSLLSILTLCWLSYSIFSSIFICCFVSPPIFIICPVTFSLHCNSTSLSRFISPPSFSNFLFNFLSLYFLIYFLYHFCTFYCKFLS